MLFSVFFFIFCSLYFKFFVYEIFIFVFWFLFKALKEEFADAAQALMNGKKKIIAFIYLLNLFFFSFFSKCNKSVFFLSKGIKGNEFAHIKKLKFFLCHYNVMQSFFEETQDY